MLEGYNYAMALYKNAELTKEADNLAQLKSGGSIRVAFE